MVTMPRVVRSALLAASAALLLGACAGTPNNSRRSAAESWPAQHQAALAEAKLVPEPAAYEIRYFDWVDRDRQREVLAKLYLPGAFEGHPMRKDFPLLSRRVKPWPGIVDVEQMPGDDEGDEGGEG